MTLKNPDAQDRQYNLDNLFGQGSFFPNTDWSRTRPMPGAGTGLSESAWKREIWNRKPRRGGTRHSSGLTPEASGHEDPDTHEKVIEENVYFAPEIFPRARLDEAAEHPDELPRWLSYFLADVLLAQSQPGIIVANMKKWSGDHCASDPSDTQGIFFSNRRFPAPPSILDISPTVLRLLGVAPPGALDGTPSVRNDPQNFREGVCRRQNVQGQTVASNCGSAVATAHPPAIYPQDGVCFTGAMHAAT